MDEPAQFGKYLLDEYLGGGMSRVYKARDPFLGRTVVVKILPEGSCVDPQAAERFRLEAQTLAKVAHPHVVTIYDFGIEKGTPYIVMEYVAGEDLRSLIQAGRVGGLQDKLAIALEIARALDHIHRLNIIHRDVKPENVQITDGGGIKLIDFGIAKAGGRSLTQAGFSLGSPQFMAPEQVRGEQPTRLVDVYAFGVLLFELLTGIRAVEGESIETLFYRILYEPLDLAPLRQAGVPERISKLVARCVEKDAPRRPQSLAEVVRELERVDVEPVKTPIAPRARRVPLWPLAAALAVLLAGGGTYLALRHRPAPAPPPVVRQQPPPPPATPASIATSTGEMVLVPEGVFLSSREGTPVRVPAFYIDRTEVSNAAYRRFCEETRRALPPGVPQDRPDYPVVNVTLEDAEAFATWAGKRLPAAVEWEKAARGVDGRLFPWGSERDPGRANLADSGPAAAPLPVNSMPEGASPFQALHMAGNVWEWTDDPRPPSPAALEEFRKLMQPPPIAGERWTTMRGGAFNTSLVDGILYDYASVPARFRGDALGFRCVKNTR